MSHSQEIYEGAVIISDAHYSHKRPELLKLIKKIAAKELPATQLILMGDIFDTLFENVTYTQKINSQLIKLINQINETIEVIYLEGNHDFNLQSIFPNADVYPIAAQPVLCTFEDVTVYLAHGDFDVGFAYSVYTSFIRNSFVLSTLSVIDTIFKHIILKKLDIYLAKKDDCKEFIGFKEFVKRRSLEQYSCDYFIEGHFHQNSSFECESFHYINLAAFACNQRYFIVKSSQDNKILKEETL